MSEFETPEDQLLKTRYLMQFSDGSAWAVPMSMVCVAIANKNDDDPQETVYVIAVQFSKMSVKKFDVYIDALVKSTLVWSDISESAVKVFDPVSMDFSKEFLDCKVMVK